MFELDLQKYFSDINLKHFKNKIYPGANVLRGFLV